MKVSISLPDDDVTFVDEYAQRNGSPSRSSVVHRAIALLREAELEQEYAAAFAEWEGSEDAEFWARTTGDGITDAAR
jgi:Arc/MetJ-type ribon-helix-helix transcriptional regulator